MGVARRQTTGSGTYIPRSSRLSLVPGLGLDKMYQAATEYSPRFWGLEAENSIAPIPATTSIRLIQLQKMLRVVPNIDANTRKWAFESTAKIEQVAKAKQTRRVGVKGLLSGAVAPPATYIEAYHEPLTKMGVLSALFRADDPIVEIIGAVEDWRMQQATQPSSQYLNLGYTSFELFLFSVRGEEVTRLIGQVALENDAQQR